VWPYISVSSAGSTRDLPYERRRELRKDQSVLTFVGYATGSDQPERRFTAADAAAELGIRWGDYMAVETR
jgi:hypothetical protein